MEHHLSSFYLRWLLSQVNDKLKPLFACSGSVFWPLWLSKDFLFRLGSEKQRVAGSGFPTCSDAGCRVLFPGGSLSVPSEPPTRAGWTGCAPQRLLPAGQPAETCHRHDHYQPLRWWLHLAVIVVFQLLLLDYYYFLFFFVQGKGTSSSSGFERGAWRAQFCSEVLCDTSSTLSLYCGSDCNLLVCSQAGKKVNSGLRHPYAIETGCTLGLVAMVTFFFRNQTAARNCSFRNQDAVWFFLETKLQLYPTLSYWYRASVKQSLCLLITITSSCFRNKTSFKLVLDLYIGTEPCIHQTRTLKSFLVML